MSGNKKPSRFFSFAYSINSFLSFISPALFNISAISYIFAPSGIVILTSAISPFTSFSITFFNGVLPENSYIPDFNFSEHYIFLSKIKTFLHF